MFKLKYIGLFCFFTALQIEAQSWLSRQWHNSVSHYNYYYNANLLVSDVREETLMGFQDNFKDVLALYPISDQSYLKGNASRMDEVLKKCSRIIEKHNKSKWVDDSYLLMGDARLFKGEFYAAIEVYEYVAGTYKKSVAAAQAEINLVITYILLKKFEDAEALYIKLSNKKDFPAKLKVQLDIAGAAVNIKQQKYPKAIKLLEEAIPKVKNKLKKVRYNFVLAQLYSINKENPKATEKYKKVIKLNPPYLFAFNAKLNMAKAINVKNRSEVKNAKQVLRDMLRDDKNIDYFDQIYFELGNLEMADNNSNAAIVEYKSCLRSNGKDLGIKSLAYLALADIYFKNQNYENAQVYYDSAARTVDISHPDYQQIQNKNSILNELIKHLVNIREKDSLLRLAGNEKLRELTIDRLIQEEKDRIEEEKLRQENQKNQLNNISGMNTPGAAPINTSFPFYNMAARNKGLQDFQRIWGARDLMDFWAISSNKTKLWEKIDQEQKTNDMGGEIKKSTIDKAPDERKKYYESIPFTKLEKEKMKDEMAESYFLGANVYYQDLREFDKAKQMLEELLSKYPGNKYQMNAWYLLARIHKEQGHTEKTNHYINLIKTTDSSSNFLNVLLNQETTDTAQNKKIKVELAIEQLYNKAYMAYKAKDFEEALRLKSENDMKYPGNPLQVNFDYLDALITGEKGDIEQFQVKLQAIADNYPSSEIANQALRTIELIKRKSGESDPKMAGGGKYKYDLKAEHFYMLLLPKGTDMTQVKLAFLNYNKSFFENAGLRVTTSLLGESQVLIVNNFGSYQIAKDYIGQMMANAKFFDDLKISDTSKQYLISKENFSVLITDKILADYLLFYQTNYKF